MPDGMDTQNNGQTTPPAQGHGDGNSSATQVPSWVKVLPYQLQNDPAVTKYSSIGEFVNAFKGMDAIAGKSVVIPDATATAEEVQTFYAKLGRPQTPDGYQFSKLDGLSEQEVASIKKIAYENGLNKKQADAFVAFLSSNQEATKKATEEARQAKLKSHTEEAQKRWGKDVALAVERAKKGASIVPALVDKLAQANLLDDPDVIEIFGRIADLNKNDSLVRGQSWTPPSGKSRYPSMDQ